MDKRIIVPKPKDDSIGQSAGALFKVLEETNQLQTGDRVCIDLSKISFVTPFLILPLSTLISFLRNKGIEVTTTVHEKCDSYLNTIYFPEGINPITTYSWRNTLNGYATKTYLPVCAIPSKEDMSDTREELISTFESILVNQLSLSGQLRTSISYLLGEAITNIVDHAKVEKGFIMIQNYPQKEFLDVCIADAGIGILETYNSERFSEIKTDVQALEYAVKGKSTKDQAITRGYGISTSRNMLVKGLQGKYFLFSGKAFFFYSEEQEFINEVDDSIKWNGTMLALRIPKNIPETFNYSDYLE